jgi:hypothetical protein
MECSSHVCWCRGPSSKFARLWPTASSRSMAKPGSATKGWSAIHLGSLVSLSVPHPEWDLAEEVDRTPGDFCGGGWFGRRGQNSQQRGMGWTSGPKWPAARSGLDTGAGVANGRGKTCKGDRKSRGLGRLGAGAGVVGGEGVGAKALVAACCDSFLDMSFEVKVRLIKIKINKLMYG